MARKPVSQSNTQWNAKGSRRADGSIIEKGYLSQKGKDTKRVTGRVNLVVGKRTGQTQKYVDGNKAKGGSSAAVGGYNPSTRSYTSTGLTAAQIAARKADAAKAALDAKNKKLGPVRGYQAGRGMTAQSPSARASRLQAGVSATAARDKKARGMTSATVASAKKTPKPAGPQYIPGWLNPFYGAEERNRRPKKDPYPATYKPPTTAQKAAVTYLANGNARVYDAKQKKMITVAPTDPRHPKYRKKGS